MMTWTCSSGLWTMLTPAFMSGGVSVRGVTARVKPSKPRPKRSTTRSWVTLPATAIMMRGGTYSSEVGEHRRAIVTVHGLARAEDRASERMALPELCGEEVMDQVVGRVLHHLDLLEHNRLFALELLGVEDRVQEDVGQEIDRERQVLVEHLDIEAGVLLRGEGVHLAADR